jgi:hypothetical protein
METKNPHWRRGCGDYWYYQSHRGGLGHVIGPRDGKFLAGCLAEDAQFDTLREAKHFVERAVGKRRS